MPPLRAALPCAGSRRGRRSYCGRPAPGPMDRVAGRPPVGGPPSGRLMRGIAPTAWETALPLDGAEHRWPAAGWSERCPSPAAPGEFASGRRRSRRAGNPRHGRGPVAGCPFFADFLWASKESQVGARHRALQNIPPSGGTKSWGSRRGRRCSFEPETAFPCPFPHRHRKTRFPHASASRRTSLCGGRGGGAAPTSPVGGPPSGRWVAAE